MAQSVIPPREVFSKIKIHDDGAWYNSSQQILNTEILLFFKKNLHADSKGLYIHNTVSNLSEKVYIEVNGPIMHCIGYYNNNFIMETGETLPSTKVDLFFNNNKTNRHSKMENFYLTIAKLRSRAKLRRQAVIDISPELDITDKEIIWRNKAVPTIKDIQWFFNKGR